jgi:hypothetical protein
MSVGFVTNAQNIDSIQNPTISITVSGTNPVLMAGIGLDSATATVSSVSWSLGSGTPLEVKNARSGTAFGSLWAIPAPVAGAGTLTINKSAAAINHQIDALVYSDAHQATPCPAADAVSSVAASASETLTPANLTANDATCGMGVNTVGDNPTGVNPNNRYTNSTTSVNLQTGDNTGTTGVTVTYSPGSGGSYAKIAARIVQASGPYTVQQADSFFAQGLGSILRE